MLAAAGRLGLLLCRRGGLATARELGMADCASLSSSTRLGVLSCRVKRCRMRPPQGTLVQRCSYGAARANGTRTESPARVSTGARAWGGTGPDGFVVAAGARPPDHGRLVVMRLAFMGRHHEFSPRFAKRVASEDSAEKSNGWEVLASRARNRS